MITKEEIQRRAREWQKNVKGVYKQNLTPKDLEEIAELRGKDVVGLAKRVSEVDDPVHCAVQCQLHSYLADQFGADGQFQHIADAAIAEAIALSQG